MSSNLVPPQVIVDTPRPHLQKESGEFNGLISVSLSNFVNAANGATNTTSQGGGKSPTSRKSPSPRISPRASPRLMKKKAS